MITIKKLNKLILCSCRSHRNPREAVVFEAEASLDGGQFKCQGERIMVTLRELPSGAKQFVDVQLKILDSKGRQAPIDGPLVQTIQNEAAIEVSFDELTRKAKVKYADAGAWQITWSGDAAIDQAEVRPFSIIVDGNNLGGEAIVFEAEVGPVQEEGGTPVPEPTPAAARRR